MKLILTILLGVLLVTYAWGWFTNVQAGYMSTQRYTSHYFYEVDGLIRYGIERTRKLFVWAKEPLPDRKEFTL